MYWTLGHYDHVCIFEPPNDETAVSVLLSAGILGNIRAQTLRSFTTAEMERFSAIFPDHSEKSERFETNQTLAIGQL